MACVVLTFTRRDQDRQPPRRIRPYRLRRNCITDGSSGQRRVDSVDHLVLPSTTTGASSLISRNTIAMTSNTCRTPPSVVLAMTPSSHTTSRDDEDRHHRARSSSGRYGNKSQGAVASSNDALALTAEQQAAIGFLCGVNRHTRCRAHKCDLHHVEFPCNQTENLC